MSTALHHPQAPRRDRGAAGFTLPELLITIAIIAILATIAITAFSNILPSIRHSAAEDSAAFLNRGVHHYNQVNSDIVIAASAGNGDELAVIALLQTRDPAMPGSPFLPTEARIVPTSSTDVARAVWTGKFFTVIPEGASGTGIAVSQ